MKGLYQSDQGDQAGSGGSGGGYPYHCAGRRIWHQDRDFLCGALCHRGGSPAYGVGDRQGTGSLPVWRKGQSLFKKRSQAAFGGSLSKSGDRFRLPVPGGQFSCVKQKISVAKENCRGYTNTANNHPLTQLYDYIYWVYRHDIMPLRICLNPEITVSVHWKQDHLQKEKKDAENTKEPCRIL